MSEVFGTATDQDSGGGLPSDRYCFKVVRMEKVEARERNGVRLSPSLKLFMNAAYAEGGKWLPMYATDGNLYEEWAYLSLPETGKIGPRSKLRKFAEACLGRKLEEGEPISSDTFEGKKFIALIGPVTGEDKITRQKIVGDPEPYAEPKQRAASPAAAASDEAF